MKHTDENEPPLPFQFHDVTNTIKKILGVSSYLAVIQSWDVRLEIVDDSIHGALQSDRSDQEDGHQDVRERGREVHHLVKWEEQNVQPHPKKLEFCPN